jgi:hypothetical protein
MFVGDRPIISANTWHISYLVNLSSEENWRILGRDALSEVSMYLAAISARQSGGVKVHVVTRSECELANSGFGNW